MANTSDPKIVSLVLKRIHGSEERNGRIEKKSSQRSFLNKLALKTALVGMNTDIEKRVHIMKSFSKIREHDMKTSMNVQTKIIKRCSVSRRGSRAREIYKDTINKLVSDTALPELEDHENTLPPTLRPNKSKQKALQIRRNLKIKIGKLDEYNSPSSPSTQCSSGKFGDFLVHTSLYLPVHISRHMITLCI